MIPLITVVFPRSWSTCKDKDLLLDGFLDSLPLDGVVVNVEFIFNVINRLFDFFLGRKILAFLFLAGDRYTSDPFFRKEEAVVEDLGVNVCTLSSSMRLANSWATLAGSSSTGRDAS